MRKVQVYLRFMYIPKKLRESAEQLNEVVDKVLQHYKVKAKIKQKFLNFNTARLSVVLKTEDNKNIGVLYTLSFDRNTTSIKFNSNACVSAEVAGFDLSDWVWGVSVAAELRYWADYTLRDIFSRKIFDNLQKKFRR